MIWYFIAYYVIGVITSLVLFCIWENFGTYVTLRDLLCSITFMWIIAPIIAILYGFEWVFDNSRSIKIWEKK